MKTAPGILSAIRSILMVTFLLSFSFCFGQDTDLPNYARPQKKIYKSLAAALAQPDSVYILDLSGKKLKTFPEEVYKLPYLQVLILSRNKIQEIPKTIGNMKGLQELDISANKLVKIPDEIGSLHELRKLSLNRNEIEVIPPTIGSLSELEILELWDNELGDIPDELKNCKKLRILELRGILFSDEQQAKFKELLPNTRIYMSPSCNCKTQ